jgi:predicted MFS family arabinose efflux permease
VITQADAPPSFRWDRLTFAAAAAYCLLVASLSVGAVLSQLRDQFHINGVVAALHGSTFGIGLLITGVWGVRVVNRIGRQRATRLAAAGMTCGLVVFCLGPSWPVTLTGMAMTGLSGALLVMVMPGIISDHHGQHRAAAFAAVNAVPGMAGLAFSMAIGAAIGAGWSWRAPYLALTGVFVLGLTVIGRPVRIPEGDRRGTFSLRPFASRDVAVPWLKIVNAVLVEFSVGVWAVTYLHEIGGASPGLAPALASVFGLMMFVVRLRLPSILRRFGAATLSLCFTVVGTGVTLMCLAPGLGLKVVGLTLVGGGAAPLYPLTVDRFYAAAQHRLDSVGLGAFCALASGVAVTLGPLVLGVLADAVGLRWAMLFPAALAAVGAVTQWRDEVPETVLITA